MLQLGSVFFNKGDASFCLIEGVACRCPTKGRGLLDDRVCQARKNGN